MGDGMGEEKERDRGREFVSILYMYIAMHSNEEANKV